MDKLKRREAAVAALKKQPSGSDKFENSKAEATPVSKPAWKNITPPQGS